MTVKVQRLHQNFSYFINHPQSSRLDPKDRASVWVAYVAFAIFTAFLGQAICFLISKCVKKNPNNPAVKKVNNVGPPIIDPPKPPSNNDSTPPKPPSNNNNPPTEPPPVPPSQTTIPKLPKVIDPPKLPPSNNDFTSPSQNKVSLPVQALTAVPELIENERTSLDMMEDFWKKHVQSFKMRHGTTSFYLSHFQKNGISHIYPEAFVNFIDKIRGLWNTYAHLGQRRVYFGQFLNRYDKARDEKKVKIFFSSDPDITREFTTGERKGGEWLRDVQGFIFDIQYGGNVLSPVEQGVIEDIKAFITSIREATPLAVVINGGCPGFPEYLTYNSPLGPLNNFIQLMQKECENWKIPAELKNYLETKILPRWEKQKNRLMKLYEIDISKEVGPEHLEFEMLRN